MALRRVIPVLIVALLALPGFAFANDKGQRAVIVTQTMLETAHGALSTGQNGPVLRRAIADSFALDIWARFLVRDRREQFDNVQQQRFQALLPGFLAHLYASQFERGLSVPPQIGGSREVRRGDIMVSSEFPRPSGQALPVDWRVRDFPDQGARIIDIMVGGSSFLILKQEEFIAIVDSGGPDALLSHMERHSR
jgi:ABC-type transporter MlaC component